MRVRVDEIPESGRTLRFHWDEDRLGQFVPPGDPLLEDLDEFAVGHPSDLGNMLGRKYSHE